MIIVKMAHVKNHVSQAEIANRGIIVILIIKSAMNDVQQIRIALVGTHVLKENVCCIAVCQKIVTQINIVTGTPLFKFGFNPSLIDGILNVLPYELTS